MCVDGNLQISLVERVNSFKVFWHALRNFSSGPSENRSRVWQEPCVTVLSFLWLRKAAASLTFCCTGWHLWLSRISWLPVGIILHISIVNHVHSQYLTDLRGSYFSHAIVTSHPLQMYLRDVVPRIGLLLQQLGDHSGHVIRILANLSRFSQHSLALVSALHTINN